LISALFHGSQNSGKKLHYAIPTKKIQYVIASLTCSEYDYVTREEIEEEKGSLSPLTFHLSLSIFFYSSLINSSYPLIKNDH